MNRAEEQFRIERDPLGEARAPADALYGIQTKRALDNFRISSLRVNPALITAFAEIKKAAVKANMETGAIAREIGEVIARADDEFISGRHYDQFDLDVFQAGAGASYNMDEFDGYAGAIERATDRLRVAGAPLLEVPLGGTAVGGGHSAHPDYARLAVKRLGEITGLPLTEARNRFPSMQSLGDFVALSGALRGLAVEMGKIANDLRLLNSGPRTGLAEIELPAVQPGSSIACAASPPTASDAAGTPRTPSDWPRSTTKSSALWARPIWPTARTVGKKHSRTDRRGSQKGRTQEG